ncbi:MAG: PEP-utilizing enzyme [Desulfitobacteriaceae bacterium]
MAREYGVPAVVNIPSAIQQIENGQEIMVYRDEGKVFLHTCQEV